jgi:hypothetical protein
VRLDKLNKLILAPGNAVGTELKRKEDEGHVNERKTRKHNTHPLGN